MALDLSPPTVSPLPSRSTRMGAILLILIVPDPKVRQRRQVILRFFVIVTLASRGITPVEHDDDSEHRCDIDDLRYVIQDNGEALSPGAPKFLMSVARQYRHQA